VRLFRLLTFTPLLEFHLARKSNAEAGGVQRVVVAVLVVLTALCAWYEPLQKTADAQVDAGLKRALVSFASARTLNAAISVLQGTEFSVEPVGVGVTLAPGQVLDPINDLVEQFSTIMLVASVAFGVQKVLLAIGAHVVISILVTSIAILWAGLYCFRQAPSWLSRLLVILLMIRFAFPVVTVGSDIIFQQFLAKDYDEYQVGLDVTSEELRNLTPVTPTAEQTANVPEEAIEERRWWEHLKDRAKQVFSLPRLDLQAIMASVESVPERILKLIVIFLMQTIIIPIALLWGLYKLAFGVARPTLPKAMVPH